MNSIHFVIKRLANIRKYLKQKGFLGKIALTDGTMFILISDIFPAYAFFCKVGITKRKANPLLAPLY